MDVNGTTSNCFTPTFPGCKYSSNDTIFDLFIAFNAFVAFLLLGAIVLGIFAAIRKIYLIAKGRKEDPVSSLQGK
jgi:hypothetical protein